MSDILELSERAWNGELEHTQVHPGLTATGFVELSAGLAFMSAFSNVGIVKTDDGLVFLDTSSFFHADALYDAVRAWTDARVHTAVYTHGHVDHVFGLRPFDEEARAHVIAHQACVQRFARYQLTAGYNGVINQRQFDLPAPIFPTEFRQPDELCAADGKQLVVGGVVVELHHDKGETDDHLWAHVPSERTIYTGDLFIWASPNCGNPQKAQRYPREWAAALRKMSALDAEHLLPGHGPPIIGAARVKRALDETARFLEDITAHTLDGMNAGAPLDEILHSLKLDDALLARPYLRASYDDPRFIVRNLWRLYGGWYDGDPAHLLPPRERELAREVCAMAGGSAALVSRAEARAADGELALAAQLIEWATRAAPDDEAARAARARIYGARVERESSLMAKGIFGAAARQSEE